jgi:hypothetical protein
MLKAFKEEVNTNPRIACPGPREKEKGGVFPNRDLTLKGTSNNYPFVTPAPYQVRDKLRRESSDVNDFWIPVFTGMTFLEVALTLFLGSRLKTS